MTKRIRSRSVVGRLTIRSFCHAPCSAVNAGEGNGTPHRLSHTPVSYTHGATGPRAPPFRSVTSQGVVWILSRYGTERPWRLPRLDRDPGPRTGRRPRALKACAASLASSGGSTSTNREALRRMSAAMTHRGPDAEGAWDSPPDAEGRGVLLAHRRLAILDLSPAGVQPMIDPATGNVVVFNGEIYNYKSLRDRLGARAEGLRSTGDTAVLLRALGAARAPGGELAAGDVHLRLLVGGAARAAAGARPPGHQAALPGAQPRPSGRAGRSPSRRRSGPCWPPACWGPRGSTRRPPPR